MNTKTQAILASYGRSVLSATLTAIAIITASKNISPIDFTGAEWAQVANALWAGLVPVLMRYANKKDPAFGLVAESVTAGVTKKLTKLAAKPAPKGK
jgi:threonine/homoserine efflux transporter RhtA